MTTFYDYVRQSLWIDLGHVIKSSYDILTFVLRHILRQILRQILRHVCESAPRIAVEAGVWVWASSCIGTFNYMESTRNMDRDNWPHYDWRRMFDTLKIQSGWNASPDCLWTYVVLSSITWKFDLSLKQTLLQLSSDMRRWLLVHS